MQVEQVALAAVKVISGDVATFAEVDLTSKSVRYSPVTAQHSNGVETYIRSMFKRGKYRPGYCRQQDVGCPMLNNPHDVSFHA